MNLIYGGTLTESVANNAMNMLDKYPNVCEISSIPEYDRFKKWQNDECPLYTTTHEDCMAMEYTREQTLYGLVHKNFQDVDDADAFIFFKSKNEMSSFIRHFGDIIINENPFMAVIR